MASRIDFRITKDFSSIVANLEKSESVELISLLLLLTLGNPLKSCIETNPRSILIVFNLGWKVIVLLNEISALIQSNIKVKL